jgi:HNH endonuclease
MALSAKHAAWLATGNARRLDWRIRFWSKVNKNGPIPIHKPELGPCWIWIGTISKKGYGMFRDGNNMVPAHRFIYKQMIGIPDNMESDHVCLNKACVRYLGHVEAVTGEENIKRRTAVNRAKKSLASQQS